MVRTSDESVEADLDATAKVDSGHLQVSVWISKVMSEETKEAERSCP